MAAHNIEASLEFCKLTIHELNKRHFLNAKEEEFRMVTYITSNM